MTAEHTPELHYGRLTPLEAFTGEVYLQSQQAAPPGGDPATAALAEALLDQIDKQGPLYPTILYFAETHRVGQNRKQRGAILKDGTPPSEAVGQFRTLIHTDILSYQDPYFFTTPNGVPVQRRWDKEVYREPLNDIGRLLNAVENDALEYAHASANARADDLILNLLTRKVNTTHPGRQKPIEAIMQIVGPDRFPNGIRMLDVGTGIMLNPKASILKDKYPFSHTDFVGQAEPGNQPVTDEAVTTKANCDLFRRPSLIGKCVAIDLMNANDEATVRWSRGALRVRELQDREFMKRWEGLASEHSPLIEFVDADFSSAEDMARFEASHPNPRFDVIVFSTVLHQVSRKELRAMIKRSWDYLSDKGLIIIQDFAYINSRYRHVPFFFQNWHTEPYRYRTMVLDKNCPDRHLQAMFQAETSRCNRLQLGLGKLMVGHSLLSVREAILQA